MKASSILVTLSLSASLTSAQQWWDLFTSTGAWTAWADPNVYGPCAVSFSTSHSPHVPYDISGVIDTYTTDLMLQNRFVAHANRNIRLAKLLRNSSTKPHNILPLLILLRRHHPLVSHHSCGILSLFRLLILQLAVLCSIIPASPSMRSLAVAPSHWRERRPGTLLAG